MIHEGLYHDSHTTHWRGTVCYDDVSPYTCRRGRTLRVWRVEWFRGTAKRQEDTTFTEVCFSFTDAVRPA
jgi:hypothetical protein